MSVNTADRYSSHSPKNSKLQSNSPTQHILRNIIFRLDSLQQKQLQSIRTQYSQTNTQNNIDSHELQRAHNNIKILSQTNIQNLKKLQNTMADNFNQLAQHINNIQSRIVRLLKQKQESIQYIQYRVVSVQNSQKNVTEFMRRVAQQQTQKYSGVGLLEQRIKQIQHIGQLRSQKQTDSLKIMHDQIDQLIAQKLKLLPKFAQTQSKQAHKSKPTIVSSPELDQIKDTIKVLQNEIKDQKIKIMKIQNFVKQNEMQTADLSKNIQKINQQLKNTQSRSNTQTPNQTLDRIQQDNKLRKNSVEDDRHSAVRPASKTSINKQTEQSYLKPSSGDNLDVYHGSSPRESNFTSVKYNRNQVTHERKTSLHEDDDPFHSNVDNMAATGIRGLLRKSKQKDKFNKPQPKSLPRQQKLQPAPARSLTALTRNLPPVQPDPRKAQLTSLYSNQYEQHEQQQEEQVYQVDEQGYLIDQQGNYMIDQDGNRIQISEDQLMNLTND